MARDINASLEIEKNLLQSDGILMLYEIQVQQAINATPNLFEYLTGFNASVTYFKPLTASTQVYSPAPIQRGDIEQDDGTRTPGLNINVGAADQTFVSYLENNDALGGNRVRMVTVPINLLSNASAGMVDTFYIDGAVIDQGKEIAVFELTSKGQIAEVTVPFRRMRRDQCSWKYNASECLGSSVAGEWVAARGDRKCKHTKNDCASKDNTINFGAFPGIGTRSVVF